MAAHLTPPEVQTVSSLMSKSQKSEIDISFEGNTGQCKDATREVRFVTPVPKMTGAIDYIKVGEIVFTSPERSKAGSTFHVSEHNHFKMNIVQDGRNNAMVTRTFQCYEGTVSYTHLTLPTKRIV